MDSPSRRLALRASLVALAISLSVALVPPCAALAGEGYAGPEATEEPTLEAAEAPAADDGQSADEAPAADDGPLATTADPSDALGASVLDSGVWGECSWSIDSDGLLRVWPTNGKSGRLADSRGYHYDGAYFPWFGDLSTSISSVVFEPGVLLPSDCSGMFCGCSSLATIDVSSWDTSSVTSMNTMFARCSSLASLDVSGWDTSSVTNMSGAFWDCSSLATLDVSGWDTSQVTIMGNAFPGCKSLASLDVSGWDTSSVTDMGGMFSGCSSLATLDVSGWDTSSVTDMGSMFSGCSSLATLDVSGWDTSSATNMGGMFSGCSSLASLDPSGFDTSSVKSMSNLFRGCSSLTSLDLSGWNTASVKEMYYTFSGCSSLKSLDISGWDTSNASMAAWYAHDEVATFSDCTALSRITVGEKFETSKDFPKATAADGKWWSIGARKWLTVEEIQSSRSRVADTYTSERPKTDISGATVAAVPDQTYSGKAITPALSVKFGSAELKAGTDYTVAYSNNTKAGTATATITGKGDYTGTKAVTFRIVEADISGATVAAVPDQTYSGKAITPALSVKFGSAELKAGTDYTVAYSNNTKAGTATATITGKGNFAGTTTVTFKIKVATQEMHRLYNPNSGEHFYTADDAEKNNLVSLGWRYEGVGWTAPAKSQTPVHRLYNPVAGEHHYTVDPAERDMLVRAGWRYEGVGWYSDDAKSVPLYRQYNPNAFACNHNYTTDKKENDHLVSLGWRYEGIGWYGVSQ